MLFNRFLTVFFILIATTVFTACEEDDEGTMLPTWMELGLGNRQVDVIKTDGQVLYAATQDGMYHKSINDTDTSWVAAGLSGQQVVDFVILSEENLIASVQLGPDNPEATFYRTENGGDTWTPLDSDFGGDVGSMTCQALARSPQQADVLYGRGNYNVAKSTDGGQSWVSTFANWDNIGYQADLMYVDPNDANLIWAGGETSIFSPYLLKSTDAGQTWIPSEVPSEGDNAVYSLVTHPADNQRVLVGMEGQIIYSEDGGGSWEAIYAPDNYSYFNDLQVSPSSDNRVYAAGTDGGNNFGDILVYMTDDFGQQWEVAQYKGMSGREYAALDLEVALVDGHEAIFVGTNQGVFRYNR